MKKTLILLLALSFNTYAQNQGVKVFVTDEYMNSSTLEKEYQVTRKPVVFNNLPKRSERDKLFKDANVPTAWDELSKDIFYEDLHNKKLKDLVKKYPEFRIEDLKALKSKRK